MDYCKGELGIIATQRKEADQIDDQERQVMWVRAVAVAVVMACAAGAVKAGQYQEVWNPPEAQHAVKAGKGHEAQGAGAKPAARKLVAKRASGKVSTARPRKVAAKTTLHAARQTKPHARLMAKGAAAGKPGKPMKVAHAAPRLKGMHVAQVKPKAAHPGAAGHVQTAALHAKPQNVASRPASMQPATAMATPAPGAMTAPTHTTAAMANTTPPATAANTAAGSGNLPPILH
jgi:hypothetical protein